MKQAVLVVFVYLALCARLRPEKLGEVASVLIPGMFGLWVFSIAYARWLCRDLPTQVAALRQRQEAERRREEARRDRS